MTSTQYAADTTHVTLPNGWMDSPSLNFTLNLSWFLWVKEIIHGKGGWKEKQTHYLEVSPSLL